MKTKNFFSAVPAAESEVLEEEVTILAGEMKLPGELVLPRNATSLVIFAHGSGSSRMSPRNRQVAKNLQEQGMGTLLFDLLSLEEDVFPARFDIELLSERLVNATLWVIRNPNLRHLRIGYFGASTGAAAALFAAASMGSTVRAVVSRGGRPDLAQPVLRRVTAATLLIVGSLDYDVLELNREAYTHLNQPKQLLIVPGATHLFEEPGKLEEVARYASEWFRKYL